MATIAIFIAVLLTSVHKSEVSFEASQPEYMSKVFDKDKVSEINIIIDEDKWQELLDNAIKEEYYNCDISINGETFTNVGIRAKGNSSLSTVANDSTTDRYSFKVDFSEYIKGQSYYGLDKLALNNNMSDATYMKEYLSYDMFSEMDIPTPGFAYSNIKINGKDWGLYLAVEVMEESFIERYYGSIDGNLYKPEGMEMGGNRNIENRDMVGNIQRNAPRQNNQNDEGNIINPEVIGENLPKERDIKQEDMSNNMAGFGMGRSSSSGTNLVYTDDNLSSYSGIFDNAIFKYTNEKDQRTLINILKNLNSGTDLEKYIDVNGVLRYFAVNTFLVNLDSYAGSLKHNYYLYEKDGVLQILPWDLNMSFAGYQMSDGGKAVNFPIDNPVSDTMENSPLISKLLEVDEYKALYHQYLEELIVKYISSGKYEAAISKVNDLIADYVKKDATAFYTYAQYEKSLPVLLQFGKDRRDSIMAQLNGQQPAATYGTLATTVDLSVLGSMGRGMGNREARGQIEGQGREVFEGQEIRNNDVMRQAMEIIMSSKDGNLTEEEKSKIKELGFSDAEIEEMLERTRQGFPNGMGVNGPNANIETENNGNQGGKRTQIDRNSPIGFEQSGDLSSYISIVSLLLVGGSTLALITAYIFILKFKRRKYKPIDLS